MNTPKRYNPVHVVLHWLTVVLMLGAGFLADDEGRAPINIHMILGSLLLLVLIVRLIVRFTTKQPGWADTGSVFLNKIGELVHFGLYIVSFLILSLGGLIAYNRNLFAVVAGTGVATGRAGALGAVHHVAWILAFLLILVHVGAALFHQFILKDQLLKRMWIGAS